MSKEIYTAFNLLVLGLDHNSWATTRTECAFRNLLIQDINAMMYYWDTNNYINGALVLLPDNCLDMACILAKLTLLLTGADACTPHIINSVWGNNKNARLALGGTRGDLSLICRKILTLSKVAINMVQPQHEFPRAKLCQLPATSTDGSAATIANEQRKCLCP
jgi:hypothetical protein